MAVFSKPAITSAQQLDLLNQRGLTILDASRALYFLETARLAVEQMQPANN